MIVGTSAVNMYKYLYGFVVAMFQTLGGDLVGGGTGLVGEHIGNVKESTDYVAQKLGHFRFLSVPLPHT